MDSTPVIHVHTGKEVDQSFFIGYEDGNFHPHAYITRAQAAAVVARVKGLTDASSLARSDEADVGKKDFYFLGNICSVLALEIEKSLLF